MAFDRITATDITENYVQSASDFPVGTPQQKKQIFDKLPLKIVERVNALIAKLESSLTGGGSSNVGSPPISGVDGTTVLTQLQSLKEQLTEVVVGTIPDGTITKDKFVDFDGDVMDAELTGYSEAENAADINDTDSVVAAFGKLQKTLNDLIDALQDYKDNIADGTVTADRAKTVTTDLNGRPLTAVFVGESAKVQSAVQADRASYASADILKGTIEQRLTNLGFKSATVNFYRGSGGAPTGSVNLYRQGNYVTAKFNIVSGVPSPVWSGTVATFTSNFLPKAEQTYNIGGKGHMISGSILYEVNCSFTMTIGTNGVCAITLPQTTVGPPGSPLIDVNCALKSFSVSVGFEASPITE